MTSIEKKTKHEKEKKRKEKIGANDAFACLVFSLRVGHGVILVQLLLNLDK